MEVITSKKDWNNILKNFEMFDDVYFKYEYFKIYKRHYRVDIEGIYWEDDNINIFLGHLIRDISKIPLFKDFKYFDLTTPYGYGGPLIITKSNDKDHIKRSLIKFKKDYYDYCKSKNYVCEFIRFHPVFENYKYLNNVFSIEYINDTVVIDLRKDIDTIYKSLKKGHKYNIKKTIKEGCIVNVILDPSPEDIDNFMLCYNEMLRRNESPKKYYFTKDFIKDHFNYLEALLITIEHNNRCIGASIFIKGKNILHYYLSGSFKIKGVYPNDLIIWEAIKYGKKNNFKYLFLGGGRGSNDSLFKYKSGFSNNYKQFYIGKIIFNNEIYNKLINITGLNKDDRFFPLYRKINDINII
ncbi:GNAT family N-acetyltransferase [Methanotorris formicicus]|uniref:BioF2-like acetyltransferase domain-containing protein n=1 Tax=Methanotorris formicicus Mc-S-70 TaxID=647171 RepID=H1KWH7_9EURY|nr:GNAT family N-acetyltransferase [Methanotorris formicicus]EHP89554.1 hypothetical protein MetfoDRAFT_0150 [Methanotorris formicicus Mc-S-70]